jgi:hypothetical protein
MKKGSCNEIQKTSEILDPDPFHPKIRTWDFCFSTKLYNVSDFASTPPLYSRSECAFRHFVVKFSSPFSASFLRNNIVKPFCPMFHTALFLHESSLNCLLPVDNSVLTGKTASKRRVIYMYVIAF